jgi:acyl-CoA synthetase (AMP-forming)/AMP-acid ligase II
LAPLDVALKSRVEIEFGLPLSNGYGITECAPAIAGARAEAPKSDDAVGSLITGIEARLVAPAGGAVAPGEDRLFAGPSRSALVACARL